MSLIAVLAPILAARVAHWVPVPLVVFEILLGVLRGRARRRPRDDGPAAGAHRVLVTPGGQRGHKQDLSILWTSGRGRGQTVGGNLPNLRSVWWTDGCRPTGRKSDDPLEQPMETP